MTGYIIRLILKLLTGLLAAVTLLAAYGGYVSPHLWAFPSVLALLYPYLAILLILAGIGWLIGRKFIMAIICGGALLAGSPSLWANLPVGFTSEPRPGEKTFTLMSFNIYHGQDVRHPELDRSRTMQFILHSGADIVCVQELLKFTEEEVPHLTAALADSLRRQFPYIIAEPSNDLAVFSRFPVELKGMKRVDGRHHYIFEEYGVDVYGRQLTLFNVHLEPYGLSGKERHVVSGIRSVAGARESVAELKGDILTKLKNSFRRRAEDADLLRSALDSVKGSVIVCGDFNDVPASWTYRTILGDDMKDAYSATGLGLLWTYNLHGFYFHIDQILYRGNLRPLSVEKGDIDSSDHFPLQARFALTPSPQN